MALTSAQLQTLTAFVRANAPSPETMVAILDLAIAGSFVDATTNVAMAAVRMGQDGVTLDLALDQAQKMRDYYAKISGGGIVVQLAEVGLNSGYPGNVV